MCFKTPPRLHRPSAVLLPFHFWHQWHQFGFTLTSLYLLAVSCISGYFASGLTYALIIFPVEGQSVETLDLRPQKAASASLCWWFNKSISADIYFLFYCGLITDESVLKHYAMSVCFPQSDVFCSSLTK